MMILFACSFLRLVEVEGTVIIWSEIMENRRKSAPPAATLDINCDCKEAIVDYLSRAFPTRQMTEFEDAEGKIRAEPAVDNDGNPLFNAQAEEAKANLIEMICAMPTITPALDAIISHFDEKAVAEVTGRTRRIVPDGRGGQQLQSRTARAARADSDAFQNGDKRILIFSDAGGTGRSYHASLDAANQQQRQHYLLEPGWRAENAIQGLGRTHRTHQASAPVFKPVTTDCKGELRFTSTIARRLDSLGALTRGQRQTGGQNLFDPADNLESEYAKSALNTWFHLLYRGKLTSTNFQDFCRMTGLELVDIDGVLKDDLPPITRWLNRILALKIHVQNEIFEEFLGLVEANVEAARKAGTLDIGVQTTMVDDAQVIDDCILRTDPLTGATSHLLTIAITVQRKPMDLVDVIESVGNTHIRYLQNAQSGRVAIAIPARSMLDFDGERVRRSRLIQPLRNILHDDTDLLASQWEPIDVDTFTAKWSEWCEEIRSTPDKRRVRIATGLLLPIWDKFSNEYLDVRRIATDDGRNWLGRIVDEAEVTTFLQRFNLKPTIATDPRDIIDQVERGGDAGISEPFTGQIVWRRVTGAKRCEIIGGFGPHLQWLKSIGCFTEIVSFKTRVFVPTDNLRSVLTALLQGPAS
jgi:hypothetical protein